MFEYVVLSMRIQFEPPRARVLRVELPLSRLASAAYI